MAVHTFPKLEDNSLFEYSGESNYEPYSGIVLDPEDNTFKTVSGMFRDKKDFYEKLTKRGYVVRKVFEKKVFDWIEENAKTTLEAYLMFSTAFSKWKGNNLLDQYYTKLLNDIPQLNREKIKGNPNTRGKEDITTDESVLAEADDQSSDYHALYNIKITPVNNEGSLLTNKSETYHDIPLIILPNIEYFNEYQASNIIFNILRLLASEEAQGKALSNFTDTIWYTLSPENLEGIDYQNQDKADEWKGINEFQVEISTNAGGDIYAKPILSGTLTRTQLKTLHDLNGNPWFGKTHKEQSEALQTMINKLTSAKTTADVFRSLAKPEELLAQIQASQDKDKDEEPVELSLTNYIKSIENIPYDQLVERIKDGTLHKRVYKVQNAQWLARLNKGSTILGLNPQNESDDRKARVSLLAYQLLTDESLIKVLDERASEYNDRIEEATTEEEKAKLKKSKNNILNTILYMQDQHNLDQISTDRATYQEIENKLKANSNQAGLKEERVKLLEKYERYNDLEPHLRNCLWKIVSTSPSQDFSKFIKNNTLNSDMQNQIATNMNKNVSSRKRKNTKAVDPNAQVADLTRQNNELYNMVNTDDYVRPQDAKNTIGDFMHNQITQNQEKNKKKIDTDLLPKLKAQLETLEKGLEKNNWSNFARKRAETEINKLKREILSRENQSNELGNRLTKKKKAESVEDTIPVVDDIMPGKHVNYNAVLGYANQPIDGVITNPGAISTSGTYMSEQDQHWGWVHEELNQDLFDGTRLRPEVREALLRIADKFKNVLGLSIEPVDIYFTGSSANFNYNDQSDIDLHLVYDFEEIGINAEILIKYFIAKKQVFNNDYEITIKGLPVEVGVENLNEPIVTSAIYSVKQDKWLLEPEYAEQLLPQPDMKLYYKTIQEIEKAIESRDSKIIGAMWDKLYDIRKESLATEGEYGKNNAMFKKLRNLGYLDRLKNAYYSSASEELSIESLKEIQ